MNPKYYQGCAPQLWMHVGENGVITSITPHFMIIESSKPLEAEAIQLLYEDDWNQQFTPTYHEETYYYTFHTKGIGL